MKERAFPRSARSPRAAKCKVGGVKHARDRDVPHSRLHVSAQNHSVEGRKSPFHAARRIPSGDDVVRPPEFPRFCT